jgi:GNAT superfamily N-acetyltransferase
MGKDAFPDDSEYLEIQDLYLLPDHRDRGLGTKLVNTLLGIGRENGLQRSLVYSANRDYVRTALFYEKLGFRMWHIFLTR